MLFAVVFVYLDAKVRYSLNESRWQSPARVFARSLHIEVGRYLNADDFLYELKLLGYRPSSQGREPGSYSYSGNDFLDASFL